MISFSRLLRIIFLIIVCVLTAALFSACVPAPETDQPPGEIFPTNQGTLSTKGEDINEIPTRSPVDCPDLDSLLHQILQSPNPLNSAKEIGLATIDDKIQVVLNLENDDVSLPEAFDIEISSQSGSQIQAFVPIDRLCETANLDNVLAVRPPALASGD